MFYRLLASVLAAAIVSIACAREESRETSPPQPQRPPDPLAKISPGIAALRDSLQQRKNWECALANLPESDAGDSKSARAVATKMAEDAAAECRFFSYALEAIAPTLDSIIAAGELTGDVFSLETFVEHVSEKEDDLFEPLEVGVFASLSDCRRFEATLR